MQILQEQISAHAVAVSPRPLFHQTKNALSPGWRLPPGIDVVWMDNRMILMDNAHLFT